MRSTGALHYYSTPAPSARSGLAKPSPQRGGIGSPSHAGIDRGGTHRQSTKGRFPCTRGDRPEPEVGAEMAVRLAAVGNQAGALVAHPSRPLRRSVGGGNPAPAPGRGRRQAQEEERFPGRFSISQLRTLQRRLQALRQVQEAGAKRSGPGSLLPPRASPGP